MDYETWLEYQAIQTIEEPNPIPEYDPKDEDDYMVDCHLRDEAFLEAHISSLYGEEVKL